MISCSDVQENICAYIDHELDENERLSFEEHIKNCAECKKELDEMSRIVALCTSLPQQELPAGFDDELHEKLLAVAGRRESGVRSIGKSKGFRFFKYLAPVAAALLLIFLAGNYYRWGFFSPMRTGSSSNQLKMAANKAAGDMAAEGAPAAGENGAALQGDSDEAQKGSGGSSGTGTAETNRSSGESERIGAAAQKNAKPETASSKISTITVTFTSDDTDAQVAKIKNLASANGGETGTLDEIQDISGDGTASGNGTYEKSDDGAASGAGTGTMSVLAGDSYSGEAASLRLDFVFPAESYEKFVSALGSTFGNANVQAGAFVTEDLTELLNSNIKKSDELDQKIQKLQKDSAENSTELVKAKREKETVEETIEKIRLGSDFVSVTVYVDGKEK